MNDVIRDVTWKEAIYVCTHMRADDFDEVMATRWDNDAHSFAAECMRLPGYKKVAVVDGVPVAIGGLAVWQPGVGQAWLVGTPNIGKAGRQIAKHCKAEIARMFESGCIHRIQAFSSATHTQAHLWLNSIGLKQEALMPKYGKNGEDFIIFSIVKETT